MSFIKGFIMALGMFSILPVPKNSWNDKYMRLVAPSYGFIGIIIGLIWYFFGNYLVLPIFIRCVLIGVLPFLLTGFLHLDGFMDTCDAILSRRDLETMRKILKDSRVGAFSVIALCILFFFQISSMYYIFENIEKNKVLFFIPIVSRFVVSLFLMNLKSISQTGYMATFKKDIKKSYSFFVFVFLVIILSISLFIDMKIFFTSLAVVISAIVSAYYVYKKLDGLSGDLCGFILVISEAIGLFVAAII